MKTISRYIMTLALLITAVGGAWAQDTYTVTFKANGNTKTVENVTLPKTFELDPIIRELYPSLSGGHGSPAGTSASGNTNVTAYHNNSKHYATISAPFEGVVTVTGQFFKDFTNYQYTLEINCMENLVAISDDKTEASFEMPSYDATVDYELVRDMSVDMTTKIGDGNDGYRIRLKKNEQGEGYVPAEMSPQEMAGLITVTDDIENQDLVFYGDGKVCDISIFAVDDQDQPTGDAIAFTALTPGRYVAIATAAQGTIYDGQTPASNVFVLYQGFPVVVPATEGEVGETVDLGTVSFYTEEFNLKLDPANQAKLYTLTAIDGSTVTATQVDVVPAGMPFFVLNEDDVEQMVTLIPADDNELPTTSPLVIAEFLGATEDLTFTQDDMDGAYNYYVLYKGAFVWVKDPGTLKAGKCYLRVPKNQPTTARRIVFGDATAVYDLNDKSEMINDNYYDLNGRKLNGMPTKKGVYIMNGKKVVVK